MNTMVSVDVVFNNNMHNLSLWMAEHLAYIKDFKTLVLDINKGKGFEFEYDYLNYKMEYKERKYIFLIYFETIKK